jgi:hypothetical protein
MTHIRELLFWTFLACLSPLLIVALVLGFVFVVAAAVLLAVAEFVGGGK